MMLRPKTWLAAARAAAGYSAPLLPFTSFPAALTVEGQIRRPAELPHVSLIALSGRWRPLGGRQVLAMRMLNPVTVQDLASTVAETIGPFPGGLVRAGMQIQSRLAFKNGAVGNGPRVVTMHIGGNWFCYHRSGTNGGFNEGELLGRVDIVADGSAMHPATMQSATATVVGAIGGYQAVSAIAQGNVLNADFSAPWSVDIKLQSAAETAVTITGATWSAGVATYTTSANHTLAVGDKDVISGITPSGYNGTFIVSAVGSPTTFSVPMAVDPGAWVSGPGSSSRISNMISQSYVLELVG